MKKYSCLLSLITFALFISQDAKAQILNKIKKRAAETAENKVLDKAADATEKTIDNATEGVKGKKKDEKHIKKKTGDNSGDDGENATVAISAKSDTGSLILYSNYDFVPGDKLIYFYDMAGETDAEIPGRMLLNSGNAEIQTYKGEKVLVAPAGGEPYMMPYMKENVYLPEQFTLEFDVLSNGISNTDGAQITLYFREKEEAGKGSATAPIRVSLSAISGDEGQPGYGFEVYRENGSSVGGFRNFPEAAVNPAQNNWRHVAIYVNKNIGKLYVDQHRLAVLNQVEPGRANMVEIEVSNSENPVLFRNFRIAAGGADSYNKVITEGKFIAYGIQFDVNKAILKPESMGTINEFVKMMKENTGLKFEIGGHTDSDGTAERNNILSQERADAVKKQMVGMGIDGVRLSTKGYGPLKPIANNSSAENKGKNRRVEFVKQ
ncbi:OmpA family protein [Agriterribacter sp.]|uniref:OmpA family protein n=1 Tax=Agriterribacter sp. TaxID=2821509 RepID=UPI002D0AF88F|nr:OmpA family protein [Agriterribacter sp.]HTN09284.1 OmpA family protein [Agriterribacter sp.]